MQVPAVGEVFEGRFEVLREIGRGAFGVVLRARDRQSGEVVAIKCLEPDAGGYPKKVAARFADEARALSLLKHPNIVRHIAHGQTDSGLLYLVMECLDGGDLSSRITPRDAMEPDAVADVIAQILSALKETHRLGLVHRDIKPSNILLAKSSGPLTVKLVDFGIAKLAEPIDGRPGLTGTGMVIGTPGYLAPELLVGESASAASDLYAVGIVGIQLLAGAEFGRQRQRANTRQFLGSTAIVEPLPVAGVLGEVLDGLAQSRPSDRYQSAAEPLEMLIPRAPKATVVPQPRPKTEAPPPRPEPVDPPRGAIRMVIVLALLAVVGVVVVIALPEPPPRQRDLGPLLHAPAQRSGIEPPPIVVEPDTEPADVNATEPTSLASPGCGSEPLFVGTGTLTSGILDPKTWPVLLPDGYDPNRAYPLLVVFHPDLFTGPLTVEHLGHEALMEVEPQIVLSPDFQVFRQRRLHDYEQVVEGIQAVARAFCVDPQRIRALGFGNGAEGAERLAAHAWLSALVTGGFVPEADDALKARKALALSPRQIPHLHLATIESAVYRSKGGKSCAFLYGPQASTADYEGIWRERNGCTEQPAVVTRFGTEPCSEWTCEQRFVSCHLDGGLHWPGSGRTEWPMEKVHGCQNDPTISEFDGTRYAMEFFANAAPTPPEIPAPW